MAKERFIEYGPSGSSLRIIEMASDICANYSRQGLRLSLRQLYYQFISRDAFPNTEQSYKRLGDIISKARLAGLIDWSMIEDRGRDTLYAAHWESPAAVLDSAAYGFRIDTWEGQPNYVEVMVEKQALEGVLEPVCRELDIRFTANKGYSSSTHLYEIGRRLREAFAPGIDVYGLYDPDYVSSDAAPFWTSLDDVEAAAFDLQVDWEMDGKELHGSAWEDAIRAKCREYMLPTPADPEMGIRQGKTLNIIYLGDHDPSGIDMTRDVRERLEQFSRCPVHVHRIALNMDQVNRFNPPPNPAKMTDSRADEYVRKYGTQSWELDALDPATLASLVRSVVLALRNDDIWRPVKARQDAWKAELKSLADNYRGKDNE